ncbi:2-hydroxyacid dehydrogenase [Aquicoccus sp. SCR17]|nr:2-hydroxyacid dehydrogenase [Carideicomes alvinocaridis]
MPVKDTDILLVKPVPPLIVEALDAAFTLHRLYDEDDPEGWLEANGGRVRGMVCGNFPLDADLLDRLPALEIASNLGVGYDSVDVAAAKARGVMVTHTRSVLDDEVADTAWALVLMTVRGLARADRYVRAGRWQSEGAFPLARHSLKGSRLGIIGLGRIGRNIAARAEASGMEILYHGRHEQADQPYLYYGDLREMARDCDVLLNCAPGGPATEKMIDAAVLEALGPEGYVINIGRGSSMDEAALIAALEAGTIAGAGLDVFEDEPEVPQALRDMENTVLLPHIGSATIPTRTAMFQLVVDNLTGWFGRGEALTPVPEMEGA